jgi:transcriptional regulator with XRE-family HTH domain
MMSTAMLHGGTIIRRIREHRRMTQEELCLIMPKLNPRTLRRWESLETEPSFGEVFEICQYAFNVELPDAIQIAQEYNS